MSVEVLTLIVAIYILARYFNEIIFYMQAWLDGNPPPILTIYVIAVIALAILVCPYLIYKTYKNKTNRLLPIILGILAGIALITSDLAIVNVFRKMEAIV